MIPFGLLSVARTILIQSMCTLNIFLTTSCLNAFENVTSIQVNISNCNIMECSYGFRQCLTISSALTPMMTSGRFSLEVPDSINDLYLKRLNRLEKDLLRNEKAWLKDIF